MFLMKQHIRFLVIPAIYELVPNYSPEIWKERWATFNAIDSTKTILTQHEKKDGTLIDTEVQD